MNQRSNWFGCLLGCLGLCAGLACSSGGGGAGARTAVSAPHEAVTRVQAPVAAGTHQGASPTQPLEYQSLSESDRVFIENAERAIDQYSEFLARAGDAEEYARAVKRSREQIEDLRAAIVFIRAGAAERAAH